MLTRDLPGRYNSQQERSKSASIFGRKCLKIGHLLLRVFIRLPGKIRHETGGSNSVGRVPAFQAGGRGFESRLPLQFLFLSLARHHN